MQNICHQVTLTSCDLQKRKKGSTVCVNSCRPLHKLIKTCEVAAVYDAPTGGEEADGDHAADLMQFTTFLNI